MSELTRERIAEHCEVLASISDWIVRVPLARAINDHDAALRAKLESMERERDEAVMIAKGLTEPTPLTDSDKQWAGETLSQVELMKQQLASARETVGKLESEVWKAHVPVTGTQHNPTIGLLHGYCERCRMPWPCEYSPEGKQQLDRLARLVKGLIGLLHDVQCPHCEGIGWYTKPDYHTGEVIQEQCRWCAEKSAPAQEEGCHE